MNRFMLCLSLLLLLYIRGAKCSVVKDVCEMDKYRRVFVIDAGSTGTRLMYFLFQLENGADRKKLKTTDITLKTIKKISKVAPISSFDTTSKMPLLGKLIEKILQDAEKNAEVPTQCLKNIPIYFRATAGVRAMQKEMQVLCLSKIKLKIYQSKFKRSENAAALMSGEDEGLYAWVASNFLHGTLEPNMKEKRISLVELGGGSMQISTFSYSKKYEYRKKLYSLFNENFQLFIRSYLGQGIQAVRMLFFDVNNISPCIHKDAKLDYVFGSVKKVMTGRSINDADRFDYCNGIAKKIAIKKDPVWKDVKNPGEIQSISGFYYTISNLNSYLNNCELKKDSEVCKQDSFTKTISELETDAKFICKDPPKKGTFLITLCIDMVYVVNVLKHGFGVADESKAITFSNKVSDKPVSWALGIAVKESFDTFTSAGRTYSYTILSLVSPILIYFYALYK